MLNAEAAARRALPSVDRLLSDARLADLVARYGRPHVLHTVRSLLEEERTARAREDNGTTSIFDADRFVQTCQQTLERETQPSLRGVFNLTGTVLHTNLGRALMADCAAEAVVRAMTGAVSLEFDLDGAARGERDIHVERWLRRFSGAEAAVVVNNNAAAVFLVLTALAHRKEVIVSRGELVEIGGSFRIPDVMSRSGCKLREVGTTNRTHLLDYADAIGPRTAAIMKVHTSNYAIQGFTSTVAEAELAALAHERGLPFIVDLGSGVLIDLEPYGLPHEATVAETLQNGADVVTFSGDKLLGGPQAGLIAGTKALVDRIRRHPMKRALRVDKMTLAALDATLALYANPERLLRELPTLRALTRSQADIRSAAERLLPPVTEAVGDRARVRVIECFSQIGSGALPVESLPSAGLSVEVEGRARSSAAQRIAAAFRRLPTPVIGRIREGAFLLDLRCLRDENSFLAQLAHLRF